MSFRKAEPITLYTKLIPSIYVYGLVLKYLHGCYDQHNSEVYTNREVKQVLSKEVGAVSKDVCRDGWNHCCHHEVH